MAQASRPMHVRGRAIVWPTKQVQISNIAIEFMMSLGILKFLGLIVTRKTLKKAIFLARGRLLFNMLVARLPGWKVAHLPHDDCEFKLSLECYDLCFS